jgi:hypothetical protein
MVQNIMHKVHHLKDAKVHHGLYHPRKRRRRRRKEVINR